jgi:hypothetical protein
VKNKYQNGKPNKHLKRIRKGKFQPPEGIVNSSPEGRKELIRRFAAIIVSKLLSEI